MLGTAAAVASQQHHQQHQQQQQQQQQLTQSHPSIGGATLPSSGDFGPKDSKKVEIPELIVGAILGK